MAARRRRSKDKKRKRRDQKEPRRLHKYEMYQLSVQEPAADIEFMQEVFRGHYDREPHLLREDFCGTAYLATEWVAADEDNRAWGIDLDSEPLEWGRLHNVARLSEQQADRLVLVQGNVLDAQELRVDLIAAFNFSFCTFKTRRELLHYFDIARRNLGPEGLLVIDLYGGPEAQELVEEATEYDDFDYIWDQDEFDAIKNQMVCYIHFDLPNGERIKRAFTYDWRLWSIPELREALIDAGFRTTEVYWEGVGDDGEGDGDFKLSESAENSESWIAYVVGVK